MGCVTGTDGIGKALSSAFSLRIKQSNKTSKTPVISNSYTPPPPSVLIDSNTSNRKVGGFKTFGFTLIETVVGLALVSLSGFVVTFVSGQMNTAGKLADESYECAAVATNVMEKFSQAGNEPVALLNPDHYKLPSEANPTKFQDAIKARNTVNLVSSSGKLTHVTGSTRVLDNVGGSNSSTGYVSVDLDKIYRGSSVGLLEDLFNKYRSSICPSDVSNLTFDLATDMTVNYKSGSSSSLIDLHKQLDDVDKGVAGPKDEYYTELKDVNKVSNRWAWDTFTSEYLYSISKTLASTLKLRLLTASSDYTASYSNTGQPYDVKIGIRPWDLDKDKLADCNKISSTKGLFLRPESKHDDYVSSYSNNTTRRKRFGYDLDNSLSNAVMHPDLGLKLYVEVKTRSGVNIEEKTCQVDKLFSYSNVHAVPPSRRPIYVHHETVVKPILPALVSTTGKLKHFNNPHLKEKGVVTAESVGLNIGYEYAQEPGGKTPHRRYATDVELNFRNLGKIWNKWKPGNATVNDYEEDFRGFFLCGFEKNKYAKCTTPGSGSCKRISGLTNYNSIALRPFGTSGSHKVGIRRGSTQYGTVNRNTGTGNRRWVLCEDFHFNRSGHPVELIANELDSSSPSNVIPGTRVGRLETNLNSINVQSWPREDRDADYRVRLKAVDEYGNDYLATQNGSLYEETSTYISDYTKDNRFFTYNCTQFGNTNATGTYQSPDKNCGVINPDRNKDKYNKRIANPFFNTEADCEHTFNLLLGNSTTNGTSECVKLTDIRIYNDYTSSSSLPNPDSVKQRTGPANLPIYDSTNTADDGTGVLCDYWVEECVADGTNCVQCGKGVMRDYPLTSRASCHGGFITVGGVTCYKAGVNCCSGVNNYNSFRCSTGNSCTYCSNPLDSLNRTIDRSCPNSVGCGFNRDATCGATCGANSLGCNICTGATPCNTSGCMHCGRGNASNGVCGFKCDETPATPYCTGSDRCVECLNDGHCSGNNICCGHSCRTPCSANANNCEICHGQCSYPRSRCTGGEVCDGSGSCIIPPPPPPPPPTCTPTCLTTQECCPGDICKPIGQCCTPPCTVDTDCDPDEYCDDPGACSASCEPCPGGVACTVDSDCPNHPNELCENGGTCGASCCTVECNTDRECSKGFTCENPGTCSSSCVIIDCTTPGTIRCGATCKTPACSSDADCGATQACQNPGKCNAKCVDCDPAKKPNCSATCQTTSCVNGKWTPCTGGCTSPNNACCSGQCQPPCSPDAKQCETCTDDCTKVTGTPTCTANPETCTTCPKPCGKPVTATTCSPVCSAGETQCGSNCCSASQTCDTNTNTCVECTSNSGCGSQCCNGGTCGPCTCDPTTKPSAPTCTDCKTPNVRCDGTTWVRECTGGCSGTTPCCNGGTCGPCTCDPTTKPSAPTCTDCKTPNVRCDGTTWVRECTGGCSGTTPCCNGGTCGPCTCDPTTKPSAPTCTDCKTPNVRCDGTTWVRECTGGCSGTTPCCNGGTCGPCTCDPTTKPSAPTCTDCKTPNVRCDGTTWVRECTGGCSVATPECCGNTCKATCGCDTNAEPTCNGPCQTAAICNGTTWSSCGVDPNCCTSDGQCGAVKKCCSGECITPACSSNAECTVEGENCNNSGTCSAECIGSGGGGKCSGKADGTGCGTDHQCINSVCECVSTRCME